MGGIGASELLLILVLVLVVFGGRKMPELGRSLGQGLANFRKALKGGPETGDGSPSDRDKQDKG
jgi:sec-independent protein translocase protein TatA